MWLWLLELPALQAGMEEEASYPNSMKAPVFSLKIIMLRSFINLNVSSEISHEAGKMSHLYSSGCGVSGDVIFKWRGKLPSFLFCFGGLGHTQQYSGTSLSSVLRYDSWKCLGELIWLSRNQTLPTVLGILPLCLGKS